MNVALFPAPHFPLHASAVKLDDLADNGQPQSQPSMLARAAAVLLAEALENVRQKIGGNAFAVVGDGDAGAGIDAFDEHFNVADVRAELDGVGEEVPHHLLNAQSDRR